MSDGKTGASSVNQAIDLIKSARKAEARNLLLKILEENPRNEQAWVALAACAASKAEFERSVQQALKLNPLNAQALNLAQQNKIEMPAAAKIASKTMKKKAKSAKKKSGGQSGGGRRRRILLFLLLLIALGAAAVYLTQSKETDEDVASSDTVVSTEEAEVVTTEEPEVVTTEEPEVVTTEEAEPISTEEAEVVVTPETTEEVAIAATEVPTEIPTEAPTEVPTEAPTEIPTEAATEVPTVAPTTTPARAPITSPTEIAVNTRVPDQGLFTSDSAADYLVDVTVQAGVSEDDLHSSAVYQPTDALNLVIDLTDHGDPLSLTAIVQSQDAESPSRSVVNRLLPAGTALQVIISIQQPSGEWQPGEWTVQLQINNETVQETGFTIAGGADEVAQSNASAEAPSPTPNPSPTPEESGTEPTLRLTFDADSVYLKNISDDIIDVSALRFVQTDLNDREISFDVVNWQQGPSTTVGSVYQLQPDSCFRLGVREGIAAATPGDCIRLSQWRVAAAHNLFWIKRENGADTFNVVIGEEIIAECEIAADTCDFAIPEDAR